MDILPLFCIQLQGFYMIDINNHYYNQQFPTLPDSSAFLRQAQDRLS